MLRSQTCSALPYLPAQEQLRVHAVLHHVRRAPFARDHRVVPEVPPEVVRQVLRSAVVFPATLDLECLRVHHEDAARAVALAIAERVDVDTVGPAVRGVRAAVAGLPNDFVGLDHLDEARLPRVGHRVQDVNPR